MIRRVVAALAAALVAGVALILAASAALDITWDPEAAVGMALSAVFLTQYLVIAALLARKVARR